MAAACWLGLTGKRAVVTGGASGIGRATSEGLLKAGCDVTIVDLHQERIDQTIGEIVKTSLGSAGGTLSGRAVDVSSADGVTKLWESLGPASVLVNAAGITKDGWLERMDEFSWDAVLNVNLKGTFLMTQGMSRQWKLSNCAEDGKTGSIINISSIIGKTGASLKCPRALDWSPGPSPKLCHPFKTGNLGQANYAASKAGVIGFTKTAAKELARDAVRCNVILPGFIATPMTEAVPDKVSSPFDRCWHQKRLRPRCFPSPSSLTPALPRSLDKSGYRQDPPDDSDGPYGIARGACGCDGVSCF